MGASDLRLTPASGLRLNQLTSKRDRQTVEEPVYSESWACRTCKRTRWPGEFTLAQRAARTVDARAEVCNYCQQFMRKFWLRQEASLAWQERAACAGMDEEIFFPEPGETGFPWQETCASCPVKKECLRYGEDSRSEGVFGGVVMSLRYHSEREKK